jgi:hypothetical protein
MTSKLVKKLAESPTGNAYIDNGQDELLKMFDDSLSLEEQRAIAKQTYVEMYLNRFPNKSSEEVETIVEKALCNIEKRSLSIPTQSLKRVDTQLKNFEKNGSLLVRQLLGRVGEWLMKLGEDGHLQIKQTKDKYPLIKQLEDGDYLIAGKRVEKYHCSQQYLSEQEGQDIILSRKFLPSDIIKSINYKRAEFSRGGELGEIYESYMNLLREEAKFCLVIPSVPVKKSLEDKLVRYLEKINKDPQYNGSDFRNDYLTRYFPQDFVIGRVKNLRNINEMDLLK